MNTTDVEIIYETDITNMNREQLISLFSEYISKTEYLNRRQNLIREKTEENNNKRSRKLLELDRRYKDFYSNNLQYYENKFKNFKKRIKDMKDKLSKVLINDGMIKFRYLFAIIYLPVLLVLTIIYLISPEPNGDPKFFEAITYISLYLFGVTLLAYIPLKLIIGILERLINPIAYILGSLISIVAIKIARFSDRARAKKKGITISNAEEVFKLADIRQEINNDFDKLESKIRSFDKIQSIRTKDDIRIINNIIPMTDKKLNYMYYIYDQLSIGANENWKECINDLKLQIRHNDITNEIRNVSIHINKSNDLLTNLNIGMQSNFSRMEDMISSETSRINNRLDGFFETIYNDPYPLYYYSKY